MAGEGWGTKKGWSKFYYGLKEGAGNALIAAPIAIGLTGVYVAVRNKVFPPKTQAEQNESANTLILSSIIGAAIIPIEDIEKTKGLPKKAGVIAAFVAGAIAGTELFNIVRRTLFPSKPEHVSSEIDPPALGAPACVYINNDGHQKKWGESVAKNQATEIGITR